MKTGQTYRVVKATPIRPVLLGPNTQSAPLYEGEKITFVQRTYRLDLQMDLFVTQDGFRGAFYPHDQFGFADMSYLEEV